MKVMSTVVAGLTAWRERRGEALAAVAKRMARVALLLRENILMALWWLLPRPSKVTVDAERSGSVCWLYFCYWIDELLLLDVGLSDWRSRPSLYTSHP